MSDEPAESTPKTPSFIETAREVRDRNYKKARDKLKNVRELAAELSGSGQWESTGKLATSGRHGA